jgi:hypothetical protein
MKSKTKQQRDVVRRPAPNRPQDATQEAFNIVRKECQGTAPKLKRAGRRTR